mgnify:CR=1 FL=1
MSKEERRKNRWIPFEGVIKKLLLLFLLIMTLKINNGKSMKLCCPENSYLIKYSNICSDNKTHYDLHCETGALLLDPNDGDDDDKFTIESNGSLIIFGGEERNQDE